MWYAVSSMSSWEGWDHTYGNYGHTDDGGNNWYSLGNAPAERGLPVSEYSANLVKKAVVGAGHAEKAQVQMMVRQILPGCGITAPDAADALAVAICHAHHMAVRLKV